jgi:hypothetical protein
MLETGVSMERVSVLLGHSSIKVAEKHSSPWVRARQEQLEADVASNECDYTPNLFRTDDRFQPKIHPSCLLR